MDKKKLELSTYFDSYFENEPIQNAEKVAKDNQLNTLALMFQELFGKYGSGTIADIGCGKGALLSYLCDKTDFMSKKEWIYCAIDFHENLEKVNSLVLDKKIHRRVQLIELEKFYVSSIEELDVTTPIVFVCRNVLHELDINATAKLLTYLAHHDFETLILQDLMNFKQGERGNVCWDNEILKKLLEKIGFQVIIVPYESKSNAKWLNAIVTKKNAIALEVDQIRELVLKAREEQYDKWTKDYSSIQEEFVLTVDRDLQIAALAGQLKECECNVEEYEPDSKTILDIIQQKLNKFCSENIGDELEILDNFRDRAHIQDELEKRLLVRYSRIQVIGGPKIGKTCLVNRLLSRRSYGKPVIVIDLMKTSNVWSVLEQIFEKLNIHFSSKTFMNLTKIKYSDIQAEVVNFLNLHGDNLIFVFQYMEKILKEDGDIVDKELELFFQDITCSAIYSIFFLSRIEYKGMDSDRYTVHYLAPFPEEKHVINVLDDYINRGKYNIQAYPDKLLNAIGRHPYMAYMAAKIVIKEGVSIIDNDKFLDEIRLKLHKELMKRLIDELTMPAMLVLQYLRMPIPLKEAKELCDNASLDQCILDGLVLEKMEYGEKIIACVCNLELLSLNGDEKSDLQILKEIALKYEKAYRRTENPIYLRESIYFKVCTGDRSIHQLGKMYMTEIKGAADYWYKKRDYSKVVWACELLEEAGLGDIEVTIQKAASLMRIPVVEKIKEGKNIFASEVTQRSPYKHKSKYVDALLYIGEFEEAIIKLKELGFDENKCQSWQAYQYGCAYLGCQEYDKAILNLDKALRENKHKLFFSKLARAYYCIGEFDEEKKVLRDAYNYTKDPYVKLNYATALLRSSITTNIVKAGVFLKELYDDELKGDINVAAIYCRYLCRTGDVVMACEVNNCYIFEDKWKTQKQNMELEIAMSEKDWKKCERIIATMSIDDDYRKGLQKRLYLYIAKMDNSTEYAKRGLEIEIPQRYERNIPFRLTQCSLAEFLGEIDILISEQKYIRSINRNIEIHSLVETDLDNMSVEIIQEV